MTTPATRSRADLCRPAAWAEELGTTSGDAFALRSVRLSGAAAWSAEDLEAEVAATYADLLSAGASRGLHPLRIWNFIPAILEPLDDLRHRYMAFNAGRHRAYEESLGARTGLIPVASGTGTGGDDLVIHCLYASVEGEAVENPRQVSAYHYSELWGPRPPSFARARVVEAPLFGQQGRYLLVSGTASIVGENTLHVGDLNAQFEEVERNLRALVGAADGVTEASVAGRFRSMRIYFPQAQDEAAISADARERYEVGEELELLHSDLCRPGLRVEIEGVLAL